MHGATIGSRRIPIRTEISRSRSGETASVAAGLSVLAFAAYARTRAFGFLSFDDGEYVVGNPMLAHGLSWDGLRSALTTAWSANWHPLTWVSHMLDVQLLGMDAGAHHLVNVLFHAAATAVLFLFLRRATSRFWPSALVAALFALHPLNVESVAWVSQRKGVLSTLFWMLTCLAYVAWCRSRTKARYAVVCALFTAGLLAKPMLVTLPLVLLLVDFWPLGRLDRHTLRDPVLEKVPLFVLSAAACAVTVIAQSRWSATATTAAFPVDQRIANALVSYVLYLRDAVWPASLACFYPHPTTLGERIGLPGAVAAGVFLAAVSLIAWRQRSRRPHLVFGWAWYVVTLLPVIGIVQVGSQARADRYAYVPLVGIFVAVVWEAAGLVERRGVPAAAAGALAGTALVALAVATFVLTGTWRNDETLNARAIRVTTRNWLAWNNLGMGRLARGDSRGALDAFAASARARPDYADAYYNAGVALGQLGRPDLAIAPYQQSLRFDPGNADGWVNFGISCAAVGRRAEAASAFRKALEIRPDDVVAREGLSNLGR